MATSDALRWMGEVSAQLVELDTSPWEARHITIPRVGHLGDAWPTKKFTVKANPDWYRSIGQVDWTGGLDSTIGPDDSAGGMIEPHD